MGIVSLTASTATADEAWWTGLAGTSWTAGLANWNTSATSGIAVSAFPGTSTDVFFSTTFPRASTQNSLSGSLTINSFNFTSLGTAASVDTSNKSLTLLASGGTGVTVESGARAHGIEGLVILGSSQSWINNGPSALTTLLIDANIGGSVAGAQLTLDGTGSATISGTIGSSLTGGLVKSGSGSILLNGNSNAYTGGLTINGGIVNAVQDSDLGAAGNSVTLNGGGTLGIMNGWVLGTGRSITVNGTAASPSGLQIADLTTIAGQIKGSGTLQVFTNSSTGTWGVYGANAQFTGQVVVGAEGQIFGNYFAPPALVKQSVVLRLQSAGSLANSSGITVTHSALLSIVQSSTAVTGRLGSATLTFQNGQFEYDASANGGTTINDTFGNANVTGNWTIFGSAVAGPAAGTTLNFGNLTRTDHATLFFTGTQGTIGGAPTSTSERIFFANLTPDTTTSGITRSVVPWASNASSGSTTDIDNLMTYDANGFRPLNIATETTGALASGANVRMPSTSLTIPAGGISINSLSVPLGHGALVGNATASTAGNVVTIASGAVANDSSNFTFNNATVNFSNGGYIYSGISNTAVAGNSRFQGSGGITVAGVSELQFTNTPTGGNTFTGGLYVNGSSAVTFTLNNQLGNDGTSHAAGSINLAGGQLLYAPATATAAALADSGINRSIVLNQAGGVIGVTTDGATLQIPGTISGPGQLQIGGRDTSQGETLVVELTNTSANTYTGGTVVASNTTLRISSLNQLGTGNLVLNGGTLQAAADLTFAAAPTAALGGVIDTQANNVTLNGGLTSTLNNPGIASAVIVTKKGTGTLTLAGTSNFAGGLTASAGRLLVNGTVSGLDTLTIGSTATVELGASFRFNANTGLTLGGGTLATDGFTESLGAFNLSGNVQSAIDLGNGSSVLTLAAATLQSNWSGTLVIYNWSGSATGGGTDQVVFGSSSSGLTPGELAKITFVDPAGFAPGNYSAQMLSTGEVVAVVPEPGSFALALCGGIVVAARRRRMAKGQG